MALRNIYFCFLTALLAVNLIFADDSNETQPDPQGRAMPFNPFGSLPFGSPFGSNPLGSLPFGFNPFGFNFSQFIPFGFGNSRQTRDVSSQDNEDESNNDTSVNNTNHRLFFSLGSRLTTCNYTATPGLSCSSCNQALTCYSSNVGVVRRCTLYCNNGRCSFVAGSQCFSGNSTG
ncbi:uncharacterized protein LOC119840068 [Zerene cesonia]|uniref:uncharacterized protein LOC119840068 n=1 Tax=Zerene cesonia TaxID=33412 RepID=UPI0018E5A44D|nr:uncharacterized protein LOC119840068 [Zerene cesonia]